MTDPGSIDAIVCSHPHPDHIGANTGKTDR
jgi:glyoxylase-like metal-dependent hydrolase (beta-lactamase superfamily II)